MTGIRKHWGTAEEAVARNLREEGMSYRSIGNLMGRSKSSVMAKLQPRYENSPLIYIRKNWDRALGNKAKAYADDNVRSLVIAIIDRLAAHPKMVDEIMMGGGL